MKHEIMVSDEAWRYFREIKRKFRTLNNNKNLEYFEIVDELVSKAKKHDEIKEEVNKEYKVSYRRNLKPPVMKV